MLSEQLSAKKESSMDIISLKIYFITSRRALNDQQLSAIQSHIFYTYRKVFCKNSANGYNLLFQFRKKKKKGTSFNL